MVVIKVNFNEIEKLMNDFKNSEMRELEITTDGFHIHLSKNETSFKAPVNEVSEKKLADTKEEQADYIRSPLVGSVYLQPKPEAKPFVEVGSHVLPGDVVCIVEAMKMMTEVKSTQAGVITEILVENEDLVDYDRPLFKLGH